MLRNWNPPDEANRKCICLIIIIIIGFFHEQVRYDRDDYIEVNLKEVEQLKLSRQFDVGGAVQNQRADSIGYDFESVMHYPSDDGLMKAKLEPIDENTQRMGWYYLHGEEMSPKDKQKLQKLYCGISKGTPKMWQNMRSRQQTWRLFRAKSVSY